MAGKKKYGEDTRTKAFRLPESAIDGIDDMAGLAGMQANEFLSRLGRKEMIAYEAIVRFYFCGCDKLAIQEEGKQL